MVDFGSSFATGYAMPMDREYGGMSPSPENKSTNDVGVGIGDVGMSKMIIRFFQDGREREIIETGLTLEEAKEHCSDPDSAGDGWFDGFEEE